MSEITPPEKTILVSNPSSPSLCRLWTLTIISLSLNGLILLLLLAGAVLHHHDNQRFGGREDFARGGRDGHFGRDFDRDRGPGGPGPRWGDDRRGGPGFRDMHDRRGPGMAWGQGQRDGGPRGGGPGEDRGGFGGPGGPGMRGGFGFPGGPGQAPDPAKMTDGILGFLTAKLTLTDDQKAKIKPILTEQVAQIQKDRDAQRQAMQKQIEDAKAKIKPILNADQQKQLDAMPLPGEKPDEPAAK